MSTKAYVLISAIAGLFQFKQPIVKPVATLPPIVINPENALDDLSRVKVIVDRQLRILSKFQNDPSADDELYQRQLCFVQTLFTLKHTLQKLSGDCPNA